MASWLYPSANCLTMIKRWEGLRLHPYRCPAGIPTIGYGSTYYEDGTRVTMQDAPITEAKASAMLEKIVRKFGNEVYEMVAIILTQNQFDALVDFAYNLGSGALKRSTLLRLINAGYPEKAADEFKKWCRCNGQINKGLLKRRNEEHDLFIS